MRSARSLCRAPPSGKYRSLAFFLWGAQGRRSHDWVKYIRSTSGVFYHFLTLIDLLNLFSDLLRWLLSLQTLYITLIEAQWFPQSVGFPEFETLLFCTPIKHRVATYLICLRGKKQKNLLFRDRLREIRSRSDLMGAQWNFAVVGLKSPQSVNPTMLKSDYLIPLSLFLGFREVCGAAPYAV